MIDSISSSNSHGTTQTLDKDTWHKEHTSNSVAPIDTLVVEKAYHNEGSFISKIIQKGKEIFGLSKENGSIKDKIKEVQRDIEDLLDNDYSKEEIKVKIDSIREKISEIADKIYAKNKEKLKRFEAEKDKFLNKFEDFLLDAQEQSKAKKEEMKIEVLQLLEQLIIDLKNL